MSGRFHNYYSLDSVTSSMNDHHVYHTERVTQAATGFTTETYSMFSKGYVEWYWVALGLVIPVFLGTLFCILDHLRRKKGHSVKTTEQRIESMCERNKYVPPSYEDVIPNSIVIDSLPNLTVANDGSHAATLPGRAGSLRRDVPPQSDAIASQSQPRAATAISSISLGEYSRPASAVADYAQVDSSSHASNHAHDMSDDDVSISEAPPSYDEYDKYELFGSQIQLV